MKKLILMMSLVFTQTTFALVTSLRLGDHTGNGGDVVICVEDRKESYRLLDFYEVTELHFLNIKVKKSQNISEYAEKIINQSQFTEFDRSKYRQRTQLFMNRVQWVNHDLVDISDSEHTYIPSNCRLEQIAINHLNGSISINKKLWDKLDDLNKASLILHELIYEDLILSGHENSIMARKIISFALADTRQQQYLYEELFLQIKNIPIDLIKRIFRQTPFSQLKVYLFTLISKNDELDFETLKYVQSLATTEHKYLIGASFIDSNRLRIKEEERNKFIKNLIKDDLTNFNTSADVFYKELRYREISIDNELLTDLIQIFNSDQVIKTKNITTYIAEFFHRNISSFQTQQQVDMLVSNYKTINMAYAGSFYFYQLINDLSDRFTFSSQFISDYLVYVQGRGRTDSPSYPQNYLFEFFLKKRIFLNEIYQILTFYLEKELQYNYRNGNSAFSMMLDFSKKYNWVKEEYRDLLHDHATYFTQNPALIERVNEYYKVFQGSLSVAHKQKIIEVAYNTSNSWVRKHYINYLITEHHQIDNSVQNLISYSIRFPAEESRFTFASFVEMLDQYFLVFTEQTHSVLFYEMRRRNQNIEELSLLLNLYLEREFTKEINDYIQYLSINSKDETIRELAKKILSK